MGNRTADEHFLKANNCDKKTREYAITPIPGQITVHEFDYKGMNEVVYRENGVTIRSQNTGQYLRDPSDTVPGFHQLVDLGSGGGVCCPGEAALIPHLATRPQQSRDNSARSCSAQKFFAFSACVAILTSHCRGRRRPGNRHYVLRLPHQMCATGPFSQEVSVLVYGDGSFHRNPECVASAFGSRRPTYLRPLIIQVGKLSISFAAQETVNGLPGPPGLHST